ncbi:MAG: glycosyltransferase family 4 protein [Leptolyngbyaceae bacterium]|nr:glycosyltransferase family 4 protein [Leptolyngbyaceae bacterium]
MRIAQISPLWESVPPPAYGGSELVVSLLTDELVRRGHDVTLFASGDSMTLAKLEGIYPSALRLEQGFQKYPIYEMLELMRVYNQAQEFDIIHSHIGYAALPCASLVKTPTIHTLHNPVSSDNEKLFSYARHQPYVSISQAQRLAMLELNYVATVYNGIDATQHQFYPQPDDPPYLAFLGRMSPTKGAHLAIAIAKRSGWHLKMAGKIDPEDIPYFEQAIKPQIDGQQIEYLGEANHAQKNALLGGAVATLFPITWQEPFGLVMVESMAAGTPVVAMAKGSTSEVIIHGKTGFLCYNLEECLAAIQQAAQLDRYTCRDHVLHYFSVQQMVDGYERVYQKILLERYSQNGQVRGLDRSRMRDGKCELL